MEKTEEPTGQTQVTGVENLMQAKKASWKGLPLSQPDGRGGMSSDLCCVCLLVLPRTVSPRTRVLLLSFTVICEFDLSDLPAKETVPLGDPGG